MNDLIKRLASDYIMHERFSRYGESTEEDYYEFYPDELEDFVAEIVKECATVSENYAGGSLPLSIAIAIKSHFK